MEKPIFQAALCNSDRIVLGVVTIPFPLTQDEYDHSIGLLTEQQMGDAVEQDCYVDTITSEWPVLKALEGQYVNVDELDYLAKRLDSFCDYEMEEFQAACSAFGCRDIRSFINMTFCCQETTVISDFSKLEEAGKQHYLTIHGGAAPTDELAKVDGRALAEKLIQSGEGMLTPCGLLFLNGMKIISLNTFEVMPVKIIQYGDNGTLIQENTGTFVRRSFKSDANGFYASQAIDSDRGYAFASISFYDDETLDVEKTANFLCEDCLNQLTEKIYKNEFGLGIINFETKEIRTFEENTTGFGSGDFYIHCDFRERDKETDTRNLDLLIFYCPLRYENEA